MLDECPTTTQRLRDSWDILARTSLLRCLGMVEFVLLSFARSVGIVRWWYNNGVGKYNLGDIGT